MRCYKCDNVGILNRTTPVGTICNDWICDRCLKNLPPLPKPKPTCKGKTYKERCDYQLSEWVKGNLIHNTTDGECCPDFSCCRPELLQPKEIRLIFKESNNEQRESMLFSFLSSSLTDNVFICNGKDEINKNLN